MSNKEDSVIFKQALTKVTEYLNRRLRQKEGKIAELFGRIEKMIMERNHLEEELLKRDRVISHYSSWFQKNEKKLKDVIPTLSMVNEKDVI